MEKDDISRKRLKKKVLERWENEGGRLSDDSGKAPENGKPRRSGRKIPKDSLGLSAAGDDNHPVEKSTPIKK